MGINRAKDHLEDNQSGYIDNDPYMADESNCAGRGCNKIGIHRLTIVFVNKWGLFCPDCAQLLKEKDLVLTGSIPLGIGEGRVIENESKEKHSEDELSK